MNIFWTIGGTKTLRVESIGYDAGRDQEIYKGCCGH